MKDVPSIVVFQLNKTKVKKQQSNDHACTNYDCKSHTHTQKHTTIYIFTIST